MLPEQVCQSLLRGSCPGMVLPREIHEDLLYPSLAAVETLVPSLCV